MKHFHRSTFIKEEFVPQGQVLSSRKEREAGRTQEHVWMGAMPRYGVGGGDVRGRWGGIRK